MRTARHRSGRADGGLPDLSVYLALSGKHISCQNEIGMVPISEEEVTQDDVENVVHTAKSVRVRDEHRICT